MCQRQSRIDKTKLGLQMQPGCKTSAYCDGLTSTMVRGGALLLMVGDREKLIDTISLDRSSEWVVCVCGGLGGRVRDEHAVGMCVWVCVRACTCVFDPPAE